MSKDFYEAVGIVAALILGTAFLFATYAALWWFARGMGWWTFALAFSGASLGVAIVQGVYRAFRNN